MIGWAENKEQTGLYVGEYSEDFEEWTISSGTSELPLVKFLE